MTQTRQIAGARNGCEARNRTGQTARAAEGLRSRPSSALIERSDGTSEVPHTHSAHGDGPTAPALHDRQASERQREPERWVTKQQLADHLGITRRWIESQQQVGLPYLRLGSINRYCITDVEAWLRKRYGRGG
jgi:hypothetical protein